MRIGLLLRHLGLQPGGTGTYTREMVRTMLRRDRHNHYVLFLQHESQRGAFSDIAGDFEEVVVPAATKLVWDQIVAPLAASRHRIDILFNLKLTVPIFAPCPVVFVQHGADELAMGKQYVLWDRLYQLASRRFYWRRADGVICISQDTQDRFVAAYGESFRAKTTIVPHGVDNRFFRRGDSGRVAEVRRRYGIDGPYVLYLGMIYPMKNVGRIVQAYARVRDRIGRKLVIAGKPYLQADEALGWIDRLNLNDDVIVTGFVPDADVPELMRGADLFVFPSLYEGFGIPLIEAMASECPVVTSAAGACPEVAGDAAYIVEDPTDVDAIALGIATVLEDDALRERLVSRGRLRAATYTWDRAADETIRFLEETARGEPHGHEDGADHGVQH